MEKTQRLIREINLIHLKYSQEYFDTGKVNKVNLTKTLKHIDINDILQYRLNLHESINDYLMTAGIQDIAFVYRVKTSESIIDKYKRYLSSLCKTLKNLIRSILKYNQHKKTPYF